jgi:hypothetical protein
MQVIGEHMKARMEAAEAILQESGTDLGHTERIRHLRDARTEALEQYEAHMLSHHVQGARTVGKSN